jgi:16S rRNA (guanine1516-N2)-methyltransferase
MVIEKDFIIEQIAKGNLQDEFLFQQEQLYHRSGVSFDFVNYLKLFNRSRAPRGPLYSALKSERNSTVIDATVGTGKDLLLLVSWGFKVTGFERNQVVYLLLLDALRRLQLTLPQQAKFIDLKFGNCFEQLKDNLFADSCRKVIYYDPMYPKEESDKKSALPRKEIQLLRSIVQEDGDIDKNIKLALQFADKLVLKRALHSKHKQSELTPQESLRGKNTRYDIFLHI